jgi:hypothetical protein
MQRGSDPIFVDPSPPQPGVRRCLGGACPKIVTRRLFTSLVSDVRELDRKGRFKKAAQKLYDFRMAPCAEYAAHRYPNVFRYDTERDVFEAIEKLRGTARKYEVLEKRVGNIESQTRDLEARISKKDEQLMNRLLGAVGVFGFFPLMLQWAQSIKPAQPGGAGAEFSWRSRSCVLAMG